MLSKNLLRITLLSGLLSCTDLGQARFDKTKWRTKDDIAFPFRNKMLKDVMTNYQWPGSKYSDVIKLLGEPDFADSASFAYKVMEDYGTDIDPVYTKNLDFAFDKDSVITSCKIVEWKK